MTAFPSYAVGTVSIAAGATIIEGAGGPLWASTTNVRPGDDIIVAGRIVIVEDVVDDAHIAIDAWPFAAVPAGTPYKIVQRSPLRFSGAQASADVIKLVGALNTEGLPFIVSPGVAAPDPSLGEENQFGIQPSTFRLWLKTGGVWIFQGLYKGLRIRGEWNAADTFETNDVVSKDGSSYAGLTESTNQPPPNAAYWMLLAAKGAEGDVGPRGPGYLATSATQLAIGMGSKTFATQQGLAYAVGARVRASSNANGANFMEGLVAAYAGGNLTINVSRFGGDGTFADWNINVAGDPGSGDLLSTNNLSDVSNKKTALDNLSVHGADIVAAATLNLEAATGNFVHVTGNTTITAITLSDGQQRTVYFTGTPILTNGGSLVLPGGGNIQVAAGDIAVFVGDGTTVRCSDHSPAAGMVKSIAGNTGSFTLTKGLTNSGNALGRALNEATLQASPATPTGTASATGVMMGLGATCHLTPNYSSRVRVTVTGYLSGTVSSGAQAKLLFGTGTAPANGAAATGTQIGQSTSFTSLSGQTVPVTLTGIITGLTPGTAYWFDVALLQNASSTVTLNAPSVTIEEF